MKRLKGLHSMVTAAALVGLMAVGASALATPAAAQGLTGDKIPTSAGDLIIHPIHHGTFVMSWNGRTIYVDPAPGPGQDRQVSAASAFAGLPAPDIILITDIHGDHYNVPTLMGLPRGARLVAPQAVVELLPSNPLRGNSMRLSNGRTITVHGIQIEAVPMYNLTKDRLQYHDRGRGNGYVLTMGGVRVYIAGDTEDIPEMRALRDIDVAFIPMNLPFTMTPEQAADAVREFRPRIVYPYHYGKSDVAQFTRLVGSDVGVEVRARNWYP